MLSASFWLNGSDSAAEAPVGLPEIQDVPAEPSRARAVEPPTTPPPALSPSSEAAASSGAPVAPLHVAAPPRAPEAPAPLLESGAATLPGVLPHVPEPSTPSAPSQLANNQTLAAGIAAYPSEACSETAGAPSTGTFPSEACSEVAGAASTSAFPSEACSEGASLNFSLYVSTRFCVIWWLFHAFPSTSETKTLQVVAVYMHLLTLPKRILPGGVPQRAGWFNSSAPQVAQYPAASRGCKE